MSKQNYIRAFSHIKNHVVSLNGEYLYHDEALDFSEFIKRAYKSLDTSYSKFFKMDNLSKLAFLAADVLLEEVNSQEENIAIVLSNRASSLDTDRRHQNSIEDEANYYPSPAIFVYTLPNICIGEISIKHKLLSENSFFIFDHFNAAYLFDYAESLINTKKAGKVLCGWVDFDEENYEAFLYLVSDKGNRIHNKEEITRLYTL